MYGLFPYFCAEAKLAECIINSNLHRKPKLFDNWMKLSIVYSAGGNTFLKPISLFHKYLIKEYIDRIQGLYN